jgi:hypothetical protein
MVSLRVPLESSHDGRHPVDPVCEGQGRCGQDPPGEVAEAVTALLLAAARDGPAIIVC